MDLKRNGKIFGLYWTLLRWCGATWSQLPLLEGEGIWANNMAIPKLCDFASFSSDACSETTSERLKRGKINN